MILLVYFTSNIIQLTINNNETLLSGSSVDSPAFKYTLHKYIVTLNLCLSFYQCIITSHSGVTWNSYNYHPLEGRCPALKQFFISEEARPFSHFLMVTTNFWPEIIYFHYAQTMIICISNKFTFKRNLWWIKQTNKA